MRKASYWLCRVALNDSTKRGPSQSRAKADSRSRVIASGMDRAKSGPPVS